METRWRKAPEWTTEEMYALVSNVAAVEEECRNDFSSHQKWEMVSSNLSHRSALQCRRKWDSLVADHTSIAATANTYWSLDPDARANLSLPLSFDRDLYNLIHHLLNNKNHNDSHRLYDLGGNDSEEEDLHQLSSDYDDDVDFTEVHYSGSQKARQCQARRKSGQYGDTTGKITEVTAILGENIDQIEAILRGELKENDNECDGQFCSPKLDVQTNLARRQANQLIQIFGNLKGDIDHLLELLERREH